MKSNDKIQPTKAIVKMLIVLKKFRLQQRLAFSGSFTIQNHNLVQLYGKHLLALKARPSDQIVTILKVTNYLVYTVQRLKCESHFRTW